MMKSLLSTDAGLSGSLNYVQQLFCREYVSTYVYKNDFTGYIISGVLKTRTAEGCSCQGCIVPY